MNNLSTDFIKLCLDYDVIRFGEYTLKSGRISPYFFNAGFFKDGRALSELGRFYAKALVESSLSIDVLFGPAYKGIPLVSAAAVALANDYNRSLPYCFNRKEAKDHGEGGQIVGASLAGKVVIIDDVITAGTAIRESLTLIKQAKAVLAGVFVLLDRQERGQGRLSAIQEIEQDYKVPVKSIITLNDLIEYVQNERSLSAHLPAILNYRETYGV